MGEKEKREIQILKTDLGKKGRNTRADEQKTAQKRVDGLGIVKLWLRGICKANLSISLHDKNIENCHILCLAFFEDTGFHMHPFAEFLRS